MSYERERAYGAAYDAYATKPLPKTSFKDVVAQTRDFLRGPAPTIAQIEDRVETAIYNRKYEPDKFSATQQAELERDATLLQNDSGDKAKAHIVLGGTAFALAKITGNPVLRGVLLGAGGYFLGKGIVETRDQIHWKDTK